MRTLTAFLPVPGDPAGLARVLGESPERWLPDARASDDGRWLLTVHGAGLTRIVAAQVGEPWTSSTTTWRSISWEPEFDAGDRAARLLPSFDGELGLFTAGSDASLALEGSYLPPGGPLGAALDGLALHRVARGTAERLLADVAARLVAGESPQRGVEEHARPVDDRHQG